MRRPLFAIAPTLITFALLAPVAAHGAFSHQATIGGTGVTGGKLDNPQSAAVDAGGNVYVVEGPAAPSGNLRVSKFSSSGTFLRAWGKDVVSNGAGSTGDEVCTAAASCKAGVPSTSGGGFSIPHGIAVDTSVPNGDVYVADANRVQQFDSNGSFIKAWGRNVDAAGGSGGFEVCLPPGTCASGEGTGNAGALNSPGGISVDASGFVFVVETGNHRVQRFNPSTTTDGTTPTFDRMWGKDVTTVGGTGFELCAVPANCKAGVAGGAAGELSTPQGVAAEESGVVYVTDTGNNRVQKYSSTGTFQRTWGKDVDTGGGSGFESCTAACQAGDPGVLGGELTITSAAGVTADDPGHVYVAERFSNRAQDYTSNGGFQRTWGKDVINNGAGSTGFEVCTAAASCKAGVSATSAGAFNLPPDVAAEPSGRIWVVDNVNDRLQRFGEVAPSGPGPGPGPEPSNEFTIGKAKGKKVKVTVPGPGEIDVVDAKAAKKKLLLNPSSATATAAGTVNMPLKLTKTAKKKLKRKRKVKVKASITFTPTGGDANTQAKKLKVKKK